MIYVIVLVRDPVAFAGQYDFILFDCPPNILRASQCGVFSSNEIYVPSNPDALSLIGFTLLVEKLHKFHQLSASFRSSSMGTPAAVQGIVHAHHGALAVESGPGTGTLFSAWLPAMVNPKCSFC